jgi:hypothetical protein
MRVILSVWIVLVAFTALAHCAGPPYACMDILTCAVGGGGSVPSEGGVTDEGGEQ